MEMIFISTQFLHVSLVAVADHLVSARSVGRSIVESLDSSSHHVSTFVSYEDRKATTDRVVVLRTYILYVHLDEFRGPAGLDGQGALWTCKCFFSCFFPVFLALLL